MTTTAASAATTSLLANFTRVDVTTVNGSAAAAEDDDAATMGFWSSFAICFLSITASLVTVCGNLLVIMSFMVNRALRKVNNYLIMSLAAADLLIGLVSMNMFTLYIVNNGWTLGPIICNIWLALDYVASNASVLNLTIICLVR